MGASSPLIAAVATPKYGRVVVEGSDGKAYGADLTSFSQVYCFPATWEQWQQVSADADGRALVWSTRFEVHMDQVQALADSIEPARSSA
jgi:hypothetical protein